MASFFAPEETQITVERLDGIPLLNFSATPENTVGLAVKGLFDFVLAAVLAVVLSPLLVAIAGAVRLSSPGPILFRQKRCGLNGREFTIYKFRTRVDGPTRRGKPSRASAMIRTARCSSWRAIRA